MTTGDPVTYIHVNIKVDLGNRMAPISSNDRAALAQIVARRSHNPKVVSSILTRRIFEMIPNSRFCGLQERHSQQKSSLQRQKYDPGRTRTCNLWFRRPTPYPLGHRASGKLPLLTGRITNHCAATEIMRRHRRRRQSAAAAGGADLGIGWRPLASRPPREKYCYG